MLPKIKQNRCPDGKGLSTPCGVVNKRLPGGVSLWPQPVLTLCGGALQLLHRKLPHLLAAMWGSSCSLIQLLPPSVQAVPGRERQFGHFVPGRGLPSAGYRPACLPATCRLAARGCKVGSIPVLFVAKWNHLWRAEVESSSFLHPERWPWTYLWWINWPGSVHYFWLGSGGGAPPLEWTINFSCNWAPKKKKKVCFAREGIAWAPISSVSCCFFSERFNF